MSWCRCLCCSLVLLALAACAQAPVQEMSDARQAIQAAREVAESPADRDALAAAEAQMERAESALEAGRYDDARRHAADVKMRALEVRERADDGG
jgi:hypothetical protein